MRKTLLLTYIIIFSSSFFLKAETYLLKSNSTQNANIEVEQSADDNGFYNDGKHKDTGTNYNSEGYDINGFDINGLSKLNCLYDINTNYIKTDGRYPLKIVFNNSSISSHSYENTTEGYETDNYLFNRGEIMWSTSYWNQRKYEVCYQLKK